MSSDLASYQSFRSEYKFPFEIAGTDTEKKEKLVKDIEGPCIYIGTPWMLYLQSQKPPILTKTKFLREALKRIFAINVNDVPLLVLAKRRMDKMAHGRSDCSFTDLMGAAFIDHLICEYLSTNFTFLFSARATSLAAHTNQ